MTTNLPYNHLNLKQNPFGELDIIERQSLATVDAYGVVNKLMEPGFAVQYIGEKGRGKTSNLLALHRFFPRAPYVRAEVEGKNIIPQGTPLFIDEAQHLSLWSRLRLFNRNRSYVIGTHEDLGKELKAKGLDFQTIYPGKNLNVAKLARIFQIRIEHVRRGPGPVPRIKYKTIQELMDRYRDDIRSMEDELYERFQSLGGIQDV